MMLVVVVVVVVMLMTDGNDVYLLCYFLMQVVGRLSDESARFTGVQMVAGRKSHKVVCT